MMNACSRWSFLAMSLGAGLGCSDPVPLPAQGAVTLSIEQPVPSVNQMSCPVVQTYQVAALDPKTKLIQAPSNSDPGQSVISGEGGASVTCSVKGGKTGFAFSGSLHAATPQGDLISVAFTNGTIGSDLMTGSADVSVYTPQLSATFSSATSCTITILEGQIKGGAMWASFDCPQIQSPPSGLCGIGSSTIVFQNCAGS
jgi:hypothetical protein